jgi:RimJ/RimL family protein N-acetyltransferase
MSAAPKTVLTASPDEEAAIREAVRRADPARLGTGRRFATPDDAEVMLELLSDPEVSDAIYDLPRPLTLNSVTAWIADFMGKRARGEGLLIVTPEEFGPGIMSYSQVTLWPERASAELAGAMRADIQGAGGGGEGAVRTFDWMFHTLGARLICLTAAPSNIRSIRLIERAGFVRMGERESIRPDGSHRSSFYWEMTRDGWDARAAQ